MEEFRKAEFHDRLIYVTTRLQAEYPPGEIGVYDLPKAIRAQVLDVMYFFLNTVCFAGFGLLDEDKVIAFVQMRLIAVWKAVGPYVKYDRKNSGDLVGKHWCSRLEKYAELAEARSQDEAIESGFVPISNQK